MLAQLNKIDYGVCEACAYKIMANTLTNVCYGLHYIFNSFRGRDPIRAMDYMGHSLGVLWQVPTTGSARHVHTQRLPKT